MKTKSKYDSKLANLETEAGPRHLEFETEARRGFWISRPRRGETFQKSNSRLCRGETAVSRTTSLTKLIVAELYRNSN